MIYVIATLKAKPGAGPALLEGVKPCLAATRKEEGCLQYDFLQQSDAPETFVFVERWESREALTAHSKQPHLKVWRDVSTPLTESREIVIVHPDKIETF